MAIPGVPSTSQAPNHDYNYEHFIYDEEADTYTCPEDQILRTNGTWHKEQQAADNIIIIQAIQNEGLQIMPGTHQSAQDLKSQTDTQKRICRILREQIEKLMKRRKNSINVVRQ